MPEPFASINLVEASFFVEPTTKETTQNFIWVLLAPQKNNFPCLKLIPWGVLHRSNRENTDCERY